MTASRAFTLPQGRRVAVHTLGDGSGGSTIVPCHAAPHLPDARLEVAAGVGHMVLIPRWDRILVHLSGGDDR